MVRVTGVHDAASFIVLPIATAVTRRVFANRRRTRDNGGCRNFVDASAIPQREEIGMKKLLIALSFLATFAAGFLAAGWLLYLAHERREARQIPVAENETGT